MMRVAIIHPWLPQYRVAFFHELVRQAAEVDIAVDVFHGPPPPEWALRGDARLDLGFQQLSTRTIRLGSRSLNIKSIDALRPGSYDLIVVEQALRNLETYELLARRTPIAFWGHGRTYTKPSSAIEEFIKTKLTRRGVWFFAYTDGGADAVRHRGYPDDRITVVQNSVDSEQLIRDLHSTTSSEIDAYRSAYGLTDSTALSIGGLDEAKRIPFQLEAARIIHRRRPSFRLLIAGSGDLADVVDRADRALSYVHAIGSIYGHDKAVAMKASDLLMIPGRVGLVAVDSFAAGRPIATTQFPWHAPEFEYLDASNSIISLDTPGAYADAVVDLLNDRPRLISMQEAALRNQHTYTIAEMAQRFVTGLQGAQRVMK